MTSPQTDPWLPPPARRLARPAAGVLFGLALGDALGAACEFLPFEDIVARFGSRGPSRPGEQVTDDTQMTLALAEALVETPRPLTPPSVEQSLRKWFVAWNEDPDNNRAPGASCVRSCLGLAEGYDWIDATALNSKGCGANMRVAPVALLNFDRDGVTPRLRAAVAQFQAAMTHGHPTALAAADLTAAALADLLCGGETAGLTERLRGYAESQASVYHEAWLERLWERPGIASPQQYIGEGWRQCLAALDRVDEALGADEVPPNACAACGEGWIAEEALACALFCFLLTPEDAVTVIRRAALTSGDSDSIAAIAGALAGAYRGIDCWPIAWVERVEYAERIDRIARAWDERAQQP